MSHRPRRPVPFESLYRHGFARVAAAVPHVRVADPAYNADRTLALATQASDAHAAVIAFPELGLSAYSVDDLFHQDALLEGVLDELGRIVEASRHLSPVLLVGAPLQIGEAIFNCAVVIHRGRVLGVVPKSYLPEYLEYYEKRQFRAARDLITETTELLGERVPVGADLIFPCADVPGLVLGVEVCEDVWAPIPPSTYAAMAGATVIANLSASNITVGKADYRRLLCQAHSGRTFSAYIYTAAGEGESTTDLAWDGQALICENGDLVAEAERFATTEELLLADIDLDRVFSDRARMSSFFDCVHDHATPVRAFRRVSFELGGQVLGAVVPARREIARFPFVPADETTRNDRCEEVYNIQVRGLETRLRTTGIERVVIGVSGGLDSTHALIVCCRALDRLGLPRGNVMAYTMPGFATSEHTLRNSHALMDQLGVSAHEIDIRPSSEQMLRDLGHAAAGGDPAYDVTFENVQAGERTSHLFRLANHVNGIVVGTGDLSELAMGWCTYGVGDQMSHYSVNASVPKTLIQFLLRWAVSTGQFPEASDTLLSVTRTEISPELIPRGDGDQPSADSESVIGPYELIDFFLYYTLRFGYRPSKVAYLTHRAWHDRERGVWPDLIPAERRGEYTLAEIKRWLEVFLDRFFRTSQFKRSAIPNAPKVGSGGSLSPRGDWRAPSDASSAAWLSELRQQVPGD